MHNISKYKYKCDKYKYKLYYGGGIPGRSIMNEFWMVINDNPEVNKTVKNIIKYVPIWYKEYKKTINETTGEVILDEAFFNNMQNFIGMLIHPDKFVDEQSKKLITTIRGEIDTLYSTTPLDVPKVREYFENFKVSICEKSDIMKSLTFYNKHQICNEQIKSNYPMVDSSGQSYVPTKLRDLLNKSTLEPINDAQIIEALNSDLKKIKEYRDAKINELLTYDAYAQSTISKELGKYVAPIDVAKLNKFVETSYKTFTTACDTVLEDIENIERNIKENHKVLQEYLNIFVNERKLLIPINVEAKLEGSYYEFFKHTKKSIPIDRNYIIGKLLNIYNTYVRSLIKESLYDGNFNVSQEKVKQYQNVITDSNQIELTGKSPDELSGYISDTILKLDENIKYLEYHMQHITTIKQYIQDLIEYLSSFKPPIIFSDTYINNFLDDNKVIPDFKQMIELLTSHKITLTKALAKINNDRSHTITVTGNKYLEKISEAMSTIKPILFPEDIDDESKLTIDYMLRFIAHITDTNKQNIKTLEEVNEKLSNMLTAIDESDNSIDVKQRLQTDITDKITMIGQIILYKRRTELSNLNRVKDILKKIKLNIKDLTNANNLLVELLNNYNQPFYGIDLKVIQQAIKLCAKLMGSLR